MNIEKSFRIVIVMVAGIFLTSEALFSQTKPEAYGNINVKEFGAKGDGKTDDTKAIQAAFDAASKRNTGGKSIGGFSYVGSPEIIFPAGTYRISDTIKIGGTVIRGLGYAAIQQTNNEKDVFYAPWAWRMKVEGLTFLDGKDQLSLGNPNVDQGLLIVDNCKFIHAGGVAIHIRKGSNSTHAVISQCNFSQCDQTLISHTDQTIFRDSWITTGWMKNKAAIENRGGKMSISDILGVPLVTGADQRWIDNYGILSVRCFRFGGEFGGFTPVVNFAKYSKEAGGPTVVIEDSWISALANNKRLCAVYLEEVPNGLVIRNNILAGVPPVLVSKKVDLASYFDGARPGMIYFDISGNVGEFADKLPVKMLEAAKNRKTQPEPIPGRLSEEETKKALAKAVRAVKAFKEKPAAAAEFAGHKQKTNPADYVEFTFDKFNWDTNDYMDALTVKNSQYIAVAPAGDDIVLMRRAAGKWPHVLVRDVEIDLDRTPWLTWKQKDTGTGAPAGYAVKVIHNESGNMILLAERHWPPFYNYNAYNLKEKFNLEGGKHTFSIRFYVLAIHVKAQSSSGAKAGEYLVLDFMRAEKE